MKVTVSAPAKLMLFGEHAVVYNRPCIVTSVGHRMKMTLEWNNTAEVLINGYNTALTKLGKVDVPKEIRFVEHALCDFHALHPLDRGLLITTTSEFSSQIGFGSSSASVVCTIAGLSIMLKLGYSSRQIFDLSYKTVLDVQKRGSGFDIAAATYGGILFFETGGIVIEPIISNTMPLIIGYSGSKADTTTMIGEVAGKMQSQPDKVNWIFAAIAKLTEDAKIKILEGGWERVGKLMDFNQEYLRDLGISTDKLESMISSAKKAGAYGAKLSGAGGGDCMIALTPQSKRQAVSDAISAAGGHVIDVPVNVEGVKIEQI